MTVDIFKFWSEVGPADKMHPRDRDVFSRIIMKDDGFNLDCLPGPFMGPLKTARVVLLYLSPGLTQRDLQRAKQPEARRHHHEGRKGNQPLPGPDDHEPAWKWWTRRTKLFDISQEKLRYNLAVLNIGAYHSKSFVNDPLLAALPSSRMSLDWAQTVLFPEAVAGKRVVVCLRSARFWGLQPGRKYPKALFAPQVSRGGHMLKGRMRDEIVKEVRAAIR